MSGSARRLDVVLEYQEEEGWAVVANLVDYYGKQQRRTLRRFGTKDEAGEELERMFEALVKQS
jgi:hypothetical protein